VATAGASTPAPTTATFGLAVGITKGATTSLVTGKGAIDFSTGDLTATLAVPAGAAGTSSSATKVQAVVDAGTVYVSIPGLASALGGKQWLSIPLTGSSATSMTKGTKSLASELTGVRASVAKAKKQGATVTSLGTRTVNGVKAVGYQVTVKTSSAGTSVPGLSGALGSQANAALKGLPKTVPVRVWADTSGRLVRASTTVTDTASGSSVRVAVTFNVTNYNGSVTVTAPPAASTGPLPSGLLQELLGELQGGTLGAGGLGGLLGGSTATTAAA
jgi:hypothetical protein